MLQQNNTFPSFNNSQERRNNLQESAINKESFIDRFILWFRDFIDNAE